MRRPVPDPEEWVLQAACRGLVGLFFAPDVLETKTERRRRESRAKAVCQACTVRIECLTEAVESRLRFGIWGGMTERERRSFVSRDANGSPQDIAGPGRPLSLPAVVVRGWPMSHDG